MSWCEDVCLAFVLDFPDEVIDNGRFKSLEFSIAEDCAIHGFAGYFDTVLYKDVMLSKYCGLVNMH